MSIGLVTAAYVVAAILFILALGGLSNQEKAKRAIWYGILGMALAVWDWAGGSLHLSEKKTPLRFGLGVELSETAHGFKSLYGHPLLEAARIIHGTWHTGMRKMSTAFVMATGRIGPSIRSTVRRTALFLAQLAGF